MRLYFAVVTLAVLAFSGLVVSKASPDTYRVSGACPPADASGDATGAPTTEGQPDPNEPKPFDRSGMESQGAAELAALSMEQLLLLPDDTMMTEVRSRLLAKRERVGGIENLNKPEQAVLRAEAFGLLITRDGLLALYSSPWGDYDATVAALEEVGATEMISLMQKSLVAFGGKRPPANEQERVAVLDRMLQTAEMSPFEELDQTALSLMPAYADKVAGYLRKHAARFDLPPSGSISRTQ